MKRNDGSDGSVGSSLMTPAIPARPGGVRADTRHPQYQEIKSRIHTDLQKGFINCEIISWAEYGKWKNYREAQSRAPKRVEGKAYVMQDFDLIEVKSGL